MGVDRREILKGGLAALGFVAHPALSRFALASLGGYAGGDGTKLKKSVYARGYCMGIGCNQ